MDIGYWINFLIVLVAGIALVAISKGKLINLSSSGLGVESKMMTPIKFIGFALIAFQIIELGLFIVPSN
jgi:hypothetical protein